MSSAVLPNEAVLVSRGVLQPFQCATCLKRFTRLENLKRHAAVHQEGNSFPCAHCTSTFSRRDLRRRHIVKKHPQHSANSTSPNGTKPRQPSQPPSHTPSVHQDVSADLESIFSASASHSIPSVSPPSGPAPPPISFPTFHTEDCHFNFEPFDYRPPAKDAGGALSTHTGDSSASPKASVTSELLAQEEFALGIQLCQTHVLPYIPFVHRSTFPQDTPDILALSLFSLGFHHVPDGSKGQRLAEECYQTACRMLESDSYKPIVTVQSLLVLQIYAIMFACGDETTNGLRMRARGVEIARREGLVDPLPSRAGSSSNLASLWKHFVRAETHKRTLFFLYQLDSTWYHLLSVPRAVSHLEIKHDLPCAESIWEASTAEEWAHRRLVDGDKESVRFIQVVRTCMASTTSSAITSSSFNALLLCLYLQSSVREVSGWSTMTGRLCLERFEALNSALLTLEPSKLDAQPDAPYASDAEAAWRITLIELVLWNPSHTNGLVELSLDGAVASAVSLSTAQLGVMTPQVAELLEPHITWFLLYLERHSATGSPTAEAPWVTVYAFKAALIAWQLARAGLLGSVQKLGISDTAGLAKWIRAMFRERSHWGAGRLIMNSLEELEVR